MLQWPKRIKLPQLRFRQRPAKIHNERLPQLPPASFSTQIGDLFASLSAMLLVVYKRLRHNLGISISAVVGIIAVMAIVICVPIFAHAVSSKVLREQLSKISTENKRALFSLHMYYLDKSSATPLRVKNTEQFTGFIRQSIEQNLGLKTKQIDVEMQSANMAWVSDIPRGTSKPDEAWMTMALLSSEVVRQNGEIIEGKWPEVTETGPIQVAVLQKTADDYFLNVGDRFHYQTLAIEIAGIWQPKEIENTPQSVWFESPSSAFKDKLWIPVESYSTRIDKIMERSIFYLSWYVVIDDSGLRYDRAPEYARGLVQLDINLRRVLPGVVNDYSPLESLNAYRERANTLTTLFYAVSGPMIVLALLFISLTATIAVQQYEQEVATMRGRGTSWLQVAALNLIESVALILAAMPLSLFFGWLAAVIMGQTLSFLRFTARSGLEVNLQGINYLWLGLSALLIIVSRFLPVLNISRTTIVQVKQERSRVTRKPIWERFFIDFLFLIPGAYAYITMSGMAKPFKFLSSITTQPGGSAYQDPLLFVAPSLFAMALCMIMLRFLPLILRGLAIAVDNLPKVWAYLSLQQVARRPQDHSAALLLIMISLSLAIYSASTAKTLDKWMHDSVYYKSGADLVVHEYVLVAESSGSFAPSSATPTAKKDLSVEGYFDVNQHLKLPAVENVTRVGQYQGTFSYGAGEKPARFMGIDRLEFPQVAFYRDDFADQSLGALMNALARDPMGVLVPKALMEEIGLKVGDQLNVDISVVDQSSSLELVIVGTYDYFPTVFPELKPTLIVNLESLFDDPEGVVGYDVWIDVRPNTDIDLLQFQIRNLISPDRGVVEVLGNAFQEQKEMMDQPERVGLFGILNVGFLATGLMPGIGFILYSYASLRRRFIQLGILQAIGLSVKQLIGYLALEQFLLMSVAIGCGAVIGLVTSNMFVPFLQVGASRAIPVPPFEVLIGWSESAWLSIAFGLILFMTMLGTIWYLAHMKVFQAVKMGEAM
ncbi:MAG: hypothetical protein IH586_06145 [Anaerolineaceae bacterium]|nr:hypothetical protein [Anaerolineaceae bacterium]